MTGTNLFICVGIRSQGMIRYTGVGVWVHFVQWLLQVLIVYIGVWVISCDDMAHVMKVTWSEYDLIQDVVVCEWIAGAKTIPTNIKF